MVALRTKKLERLVMGFDDNYVIPFLVAIFSAFTTSRHAFKLTIVATQDSLSVGSRRLITECLKILGIVDFDFIDINLPKALPTRLHLNEAAYLRLWVAEAIAEDFVWLDSDTLCYPGWDKIFSTEFHSHTRAPLGAVTTGQYRAEDAAPGNQAAGDRYFNSGVMVINHKVFAAESFMTQIIDAINRYRELNFEWADQDVLNYVVRGGQIDLDPALNCFGQRSTSRPLIHHFAGSSKPWVREAVIVPEFFKGYVHWHRTAKALSEALSVVDSSYREPFGSVLGKLKSIEEKPLSRLRLMSFARRAKNLARKILGR